MLSRQVAPVFRLLHPTDQLFDFSRRCGADFLNKRHNLRISFAQALRREFRFRWPQGLQSPRHRFHAVHNIPRSPICHDLIGQHRDLDLAAQPAERERNHGLSQFGGALPT